VRLLYTGFPALGRRLAEGLSHVAAALTRTEMFQPPAQDFSRERRHRNAPDRGVRLGVLLPQRALFRSFCEASLEATACRGGGRACDGNLPNPAASPWSRTLASATMLRPRRLRMTDP
jgi:hypothetical protein